MTGRMPHAPLPALQAQAHALRTTTGPLLSSLSKNAFASGKSAISHPHCTRYQSGL